MPSQSETGHAINVANLEKLISHCTGFGAQYNPSQAAIKLPALNTLLSNANTALAAVNDKFAKLAVAVNTRQNLFEPLEKFTTRVINALDASGATQKITADARSIAKKISGTRSKIAPLPLPLVPSEEAQVKVTKQISASQQSYDAITENFKKLVELIQEEPAYNPNETDLKIAALNTLASDLATKNTAVNNAVTALDNARAGRDKLLYDPNGLIDLVQEVKKYVKSVFGATAREFKQISGLLFSRH